MCIAYEKLEKVNFWRWHIELDYGDVCMCILRTKCTKCSWDGVLGTRKQLKEAKQANHA